jgi:hypothetical protein
MDFSYSETFKTEPPEASERAKVLVAQDGRSWAVPI